MSGFGIREDQRVAVMIDGPSFYATTRALGYEVDYKKLLEHFKGESSLYRAFYFTAVTEGEEFSPVKPLVDWLQYNGYTMITKALKNYTDRVGNARVKGAIHVEMAVEMLRAAAFCDHMVVFSGDGDLSYAVNAVKQLGVRVTAVSTMRQDVSSVSDDLRRTIDEFVDLGDPDVKKIVFKRDLVSRDTAPVGNGAQVVRSSIPLGMPQRRIN